MCVVESSATKRVSVSVAETMRLCKVILGGGISQGKIRWEERGGRTRTSGQAPKSECR